MKYAMSINAMSIAQARRRCLSYAAGNLKTSTDARGMTTTYNYDALNRLTGTVLPAPGGPATQVTARV